MTPTDRVEPGDIPAWLRRHGPLVRAAVFVLLGIGVATGQAPLGWWMLAVPALALALLLAHPAPGPRGAFGAGFWLGLGYFGAALHWIVSPFLVDVARHGWMAPFALLFMATGAALFWAAAFWTAHRLAPRSIFVLVLSLAGVEALRSLVLTGFPWALIGHIWVGTGIAQWSAWVGPHGLTLWTVLLAAGLGAILQDRPWGLAPLVASAVWLVLGPDDGPPPDGPVVRLVQPNAPQDEKWDPDKRQVFFDRLLQSTGEAPRPDLIVWPETAIPTLLNWAGPELDLAAEAAQGAPLIFGINRSEGSRYYNALVLLGQGAVVQAIADKSHLVPFGEYMPFGELLGRFGIEGLAASEGGGFSSGTGAGLVEVPGIGTARTLICYEGIFAEEIGTAGPRPRLMVLITNDAWFGRAAGPAQHLAQARLRAIEQGLPMVRVANTGISAMIDARGRVTGAIPLNTAGHIDLPLPAAREITPYARTGDLPVLALIVLWLASLALWTHLRDD